MDLNIYERYGLELTDEQIREVEKVANYFFTISAGHFGLVELLQFLRATHYDLSDPTPLLEE